MADQILYNVDGKLRTLSELSKDFDINWATLHWRLNHGQSIEKALTSPVKKYGKPRKIDHTTPFNATEKQLAEKVYELLPAMLYKELKRRGQQRLYSEALDYFIDKCLTFIVRTFEPDRGELGAYLNYHIRCRVINFLTRRKKPDDNILDIAAPCITYSPDLKLSIEELSDDQRKSIEAFLACHGVLTDAAKHCNWQYRHYKLVLANAMARLREDLV